jgi:hypothetical protein
LRPECCHWCVGWAYDRLPQKQIPLRCGMTNKRSDKGKSKYGDSGYARMTTWWGYARMTTWWGCARMTTWWGYARMTTWCGYGWEDGVIGAGGVAHCIAGDLLCIEDYRLRIEREGRAQR